MGQSPTQRVTGSTRVRGPLVVTNRAAGGKGHDYKWGGVAAVGAGLDVPLSIQVPTGQVAMMLQFEQPDTGNATGNPPLPGAAAVLGGFDSAMGLCLTPMNILTGASPTSRRVIQVTLTAANIIAMYTTPVLILAAAAAGIGYVVDKVLIEMKATATAFTGGGVTLVQYATTAAGAGTAAHVGTLAAAVVQATGPSSVLTAFWAASGAGGLTIPNGGTSASGLYISNQTQVFAAGTGTMIVTVCYEQVTLG